MRSQSTGVERAGAVNKEEMARARRTLTMERAKRRKLERAAELNDGEGVGEDGEERGSGDCGASGDGRVFAISVQAH